MIIGIDPGFSGAFAAIDSDGLPLWHLPMPLAMTSSETRTFNFMKLGEIILDNPSALFVLERVGVVPTASRKSVWTFAEGYGAIKGLLFANCMRVVNPPPATWQKWAFVGQPADLPPKDKALLALNSKFPSISSDAVKIPKIGRKPHDGIVDAYLLAAYGLAYSKNATL